MNKLRKPEYETIYSYNYKTVEVGPNAKSTVINSEGIHDRISLKLSIRHLKPKRIILFNNDELALKSIKVKILYKIELYRD